MANKTHIFSYEDWLADNAEELLSEYFQYLEDSEYQILEEDYQPMTQSELAEFIFNTNNRSNWPNIVWEVELPCQ